MIHEDVPAAATAAALPLLWKGLVAAAGGAAANGLVGAVEATQRTQSKMESLDSVTASGHG